MNNINQCKDGLEYGLFSIIHLQTFCTDALKTETDCGDFVEKFEDTVDQQIFTNKLSFYKRYKLKGFNIKIELDDHTVLEGRVHVEAIQFKACFQISYRIVVVDDEQEECYKEIKEQNSELNRDMSFCRVNHTLTTDQLIVVAGIAQKVEFWSVNQTTGEQFIGKVIKKITISDFYLTDNSEFKLVPDFEVKSFETIMKRYRFYFDKNNKDDFSILHTYIDVCWDVAHSGDVSFASMADTDIIEHIEKHHKAELVGIMSLYPEEWPYRMESSYHDICGRNIAIDTDDLVLTNQNITLVFGTYGNRDNWKEHLIKRGVYHVCWPEYLILIEMILAKKCTINYVIAKYIMESKNVSEEDIRTRIKSNADMSLNVSNTSLELDPMRYLRYVAHKHMTKLAAQNMDIPEDEKYLNDLIVRIDNSLNNSNDTIELRQAERTNFILLIISLASLSGVMLQIAIALNSLYLIELLIALLVIAALIVLLYKWIWIKNKLLNKKE